LKKNIGIRKITAFVLILLFALAVPSLASAATLSAAADSASVKTGDTVTVTITVSDEHIAVAQGVFTYDPKLLKYTGSNGGASDGYINLISAENGGSSSLTAVVKFQGLAAGDAAIHVSMQSALDFDGKQLEKPGDADVAVKIEASGTGPSSKPSPSVEVTPVDHAKTGVAAKDVLGTDAQMYIWRSLEKLTLPSGFYDRQVPYGSETVGAAAIPDTDFILLYLSEKNGENAGYYIYDAGKNSLYPYVEVTSVAADYTLLWPDDSVKAPEGFEKATLKWKKREMPAWTAKGSDGAVYLVYARTASGDTGLFLFNSTDKSVQRYQIFARTDSVTVENPVSESAGQPVSKPLDGDKAVSGITLGYTAFFIICLAVLALLMGVVILLTLYINKGRQKKQKPSPSGN